MNKDEILEKSRHENKDEGMENTENEGRKAGITALSITFAFVVVFNLIFGRGNVLASYAASAMFWIFLSTDAFHKFRFTCKKTYLVTTIAAGIASAVSLLNFIIGMIK